MVQIVEQTDEEKLKMYMKLSKKELASMVIECNKHLAARGPVIIQGQPYPVYPANPFYIPPTYPKVTYTETPATVTGTGGKVLYSSPIN